MADPLSLTLTAEGWSASAVERLPSIDDLNIALEILVLQTTPIAMASMITYLDMLLLRFSVKKTKDEMKVVASMWATTCGDLAEDLWKEATLWAIKHHSYGFDQLLTSFRKSVIIKHERRIIELARCRQLAKVVVQRNAEKANPRNIETEEMRLRARIWRGWQAMHEGSFMGAMLMKSACQAERQLAKIEGRSTASWAMLDYVIEPDTKRRDDGDAKIIESPRMRASLNRSLAREHRRAGNADYAKILEDAAQCLYPINDLGGPLTFEPVNEHGAEP